MKKIIIQLALVIIVGFLGYMVYDSIMQPVRYQKATEDRENMVKERLNQIKVLQLEFKKIHNRYTANFDSLIDFYNNAEMPLILKSGVVPDSLSEEQALKMGLITRDTSYVAMKDTLFKDVKDFEIENIMYVPFTHKKVKFEMETGTVERANFQIPVFEVRSYKKDYLAEINEQELLQNDLLLMEADEKFPGLKLGSLVEPSTDGNW
jgi:hypothetical protein